MGLRRSRLEEQDFDALLHVLMPDPPIPIRHTCCSETGSDPAGGLEVRTTNAINSAPELPDELRTQGRRGGISFSI